MWHNEDGALNDTLLALFVLRYQVQPFGEPDAGAIMAYSWPC